MKRFVIVLVVLILAGGLVFYFGWIQMQVPPGEYGVIVTRTNGWEEEVIRPGAFVWRWQRLLPTNLTLHTYPLGSHRTDVRLDGSLPGGPQIDILLEGVDFSYDIRLTVVTSIDPAQLPALAREHDLMPDDLETFFDDLDARIAQYAIESVMSLVDENPESLDVTTAHASIVEQVGSRIDREIAWIEVTSIVPNRLELPDVALYREARARAIDVLNARTAALEAAAERLADAQAQTDRGLSLLERYGQILDQHPVLLEYFRVGQEINADPLNLEEIIPQPGE